MTTVHHPTPGSVDLTALAAPFPAEDIEWRIGQAGRKNGKPWAKVLAYVTARAIMERLDAVVGPANWQVTYRPWDLGTPGVVCMLAIRIDGQWVTKEDGAQQTDVEAVKGGFSAALKRAGVAWGIGRYLYDLPEGWATFRDGATHKAKIEGEWESWDPPALPAWALPVGATPASGAATASAGGSEKRTVPLRERTVTDLQRLREWAETQGKDDLVEKIDRELARREPAGAGA